MLHGMVDDQRGGSTFDTGVAHTARTWNYWLGGKDNFASDREVGERIVQILPGMRDTAVASRAFLGRVVRLLAGDLGVRQFLDVGTGLPTAANTHEVAQSVAPESKIVYVDNDPLVLAHARALLSSAPEGVTDYVDADIREPDVVLRDAARTLDFGQPVGLTLLGVLQFVTDDDEALAIVDRFLDSVPSGSYLAIAHASNEAHPAEALAAERFWNANAHPPIKFRSAKQVARFFDRVELLEPGVVSCSRWRPAAADLELPEVNLLCGVARKP